MILYCPHGMDKMQMSYQQVLNRHQDNLDLLFIDGTWNVKSFE
jgi:hypothetical protein